MSSDQFTLTEDLENHKHVVCCYDLFIAEVDDDDDDDDRLGDDGGDDDDDL